MRVSLPTRKRRPRQALLFVLAIGLPCVVLVALSLRMMAQERELAEKRLADERRRIAADIRQELRFQLEHLVTTGGAAVALVAPVEQGRLLLPWDAPADAADVSAALAEPGFAAAIREGEREELVAQRFDVAAQAYRRALAAARVPAQTALAQLLVARALEKARRRDEAGALYRRVLRTAPGVADEQGIPFSLYAARRLLDTPAPDDALAIVETLRAVAAPPRPLPPPAVYMARDVAAAASAHFTAESHRTAIDTLAATITASTRDLERALALGQAYPTLVAKFGAGTADAPAERVWAPFGDPPDTWLVGLASDQPLVAVRAEPVLASLTSVREWSLAVVVHRAGEALGPDFPGLAVIFPAGGPGAEGGEPTLQRAFFATALVLVVSMALLGAYLVWRDVQREVRLAEIRSQFVSSVSHELKTPLTAIRMFAETLLLGRAQHAEAREEYLETIVNESERLTRLLNNVLDFSKIEQGKKLYRLERQSLGAIARAAARTMQYPLSQQGFELRVTVDDRLPPITADADAIEQAILNLLSNAMKYSGQSRAIDLDVRRDGDAVVVAVTDRGLGIPPHEHARIFDKFYRIVDADRERIPGTGLGLTLVDHVARAHGGTVRVRSAVGEGSTFSLVLPLGPAAPDGASPQEALA